MATLTIGNTTEDAILNLTFRAVAWSLYADNTATTPQAKIGISLHTADPADAGFANTSEIGYIGYARINGDRNTSYWTASSGGSISPAANLDFPAGTGGSGTATWFMTAASNTSGATPPTGAQIQLWRGDISPTIVTGSGVTPRLTTGTTITLD